jgi:hypothetical protein
MSYNPGPRPDHLAWAIVFVITVVSLVLWVFPL